MDIYMMGDQAFVRFAKKGHGANYMLCIGSKADVDAADDATLIRLVNEAIAYSEYRSLECSPNLILH